jgi:hypothetical protein
MKVRGIESLTLGDLIEQVKQGGRFVRFHWVVGLGVKSVCLPSAVRFVRPGERAGRGVLRTIGTLLTGWWAIPMGLRQALAIIRENLSGGRDITAMVLRTLARTGQHAPPPPMSHAA